MSAGLALLVLLGGFALGWCARGDCEWWLLGGCDESEGDDDDDE